MLAKRGAVQRTSEHLIQQYLRLEPQAKFKSKAIIIILNTQIKFLKVKTVSNHSNGKTEMMNVVVISTSVTRLGDLMHLGQLLRTFGDFLLVTLLSTVKYLSKLSITFYIDRLKPYLTFQIVYTFHRQDYAAVDFSHLN